MRTTLEKLAPVVVDAVPAEARTTRSKQQRNERLHWRGAALLVLGFVLCIAGLLASCGAGGVTTLETVGDTGPDIDHRDDDGGGYSDSGESSQQQTDDPPGDSGPVELVRVPDVIGLSSDEASNHVDTLGLTLEAEHYASAFGVSEEEALRRLVRSVELKAMLQEIVAVEAERVASWGLVHEPEFGGWVYFVGDAEPTSFTRELAARNSDLFVEFEATHTMDELLAALENNVDREAIPVSMRDRIAYTDIDARTNSIVVAIDSDIPPVPIDDTVPAADRPIESLDLPQTAEALEALLEQTTCLPFSVVLGSRPAPDIG